MCNDNTDGNIGGSVINETTHFTAESNTDATFVNNSTLLELWYRLSEDGDGDKKYNHFYPYHYDTIVVVQDMYMSYFIFSTNCLSLGVYCSVYRLLIIMVPSVILFVSTYISCI